MAKKSRDKMIQELEIRKIGYSEEMTDGQLAKLLKDAEVKEKKSKEKVKLGSNIDYSGVMCGLSTVQGLHRRITICERKLGLTNK